MTYNVFVETLNLNQSINFPRLETE